MPKITVAGRATQHIPAERGTLRLSVSFSAARREDVVTAAERAHGTLVAGAKDQVAGGAATWWGSDQVSAWTFDEWIKPSAQEEQVKVRRFRASAGVRVKFRDFGALSRWASKVALIDGVSVGGVDWALTDVRRDAAVAQVRASAARDAVARAQAYADALGLGAVRLAALYEEGLRPHIAAGGGGVGVAMRAAAAPSGGGGMELRPDDIEVSCEVTADFETAAG
ncbi:SIMPL domain-containing protein [Mumia sp. Pv 4-285]|uniref:SIMPL domain-containing protein n=1 Tax=Mumia qirimensis TaxID=3234852 RepID=UPI00351DA414